MAIDRELQKKLERIKNPQMFNTAGRVTATAGVRGAVKPGEELEDPTTEKMQVDTARINAANRILNDPVASQNKPEWLIKDLERIAQGGRPKEDGGLGGLLSKVVGGGLEKIGYVMGRPLAVVASAGKEISDIFTEGDASFSDFLKQAADRDTTISKYLPKTDIDWLDSTIGFTADIVGDPLTWTGFGALKYASRSGRLDLAAKAATKEMIEKAPTLAAKVENGSIARLGEWALDSVEREALGLSKRPSLHWAFGKQSAIGKEGTLLGKLSEIAATSVGKPMAHTRAFLSDTGLFSSFQKVTAPKAVKVAGLTFYGRVADDPGTVNRIADLASYSASIRANAEGNFISRKFGSRGQQLAKKLRDYETANGRNVHEVIEKMREPADDLERSLADEVSTFLAEMRQDMNDRTAAFGARRNVKAYVINDRDNYVPHTLTKEARDFIGSKRWAGTRYDSTIRQSLGMTAKEFREGTAPLKSRKLLKGEKFFDVVLKTDVGDGAASLREINDIAQRKKGFKWFEEDGANYLENYLDSIVGQTKRISFADRLFDYGGDVVKAVGTKVIPDKKLIRQWSKTVDLFDNMITPVLEDLSKSGTRARNILGPRLTLAEAIANSRPGDKILTPKQISKIRTVFDATVDELRRTDNVFATQPAKIRKSYEAIVAPLRGRLDAVSTALANDDHENLLATTGLRELYQRLLPGADDIPTDPRALAEDIIDAAEEIMGTPAAKKLGVEPDLRESVLGAVQGIERRGQNIEIPTMGGPVVAGRDEAVDYAARLAKDIADKEAARETILGMPRVASELGQMSAKTEARDTIAKLEDEIGKILSTRDADIAKAATSKDVARIKREATKLVSPIKTKVREAQAIMDAGASLTARAEDWDATIGRVYKDDFSKVLNDITKQPPPGNVEVPLSMWTERTKNVLNSLDNASMRLTDDEFKVMSRLVTQMKGLETNLALYEQAREFSASQLAKAASGEMGARMAKQVKRGWEEIESLGIQMPPDVRDRLFGRVDELITPKGQAEWAKIYNAYNKFFKISAMFTPGFIVRNSYTATFNNFVAGVSPKDVASGLKFASSILNNGLDGALNKLPSEVRSIYEQALKVAYATGAGQSADDIIAPILAGKGAKLINKRPIRWWTQANETAEVAARFSLALSSLKKGLDFDAAVGQVRRYHFDYSDLSTLDEFMKKFVPFWVFASRNVPLQMVNQIARPSVYRMYESAQRNFPPDETEVAPEWLTRRNPLRLPGMGANQYLDPDLPHIDMKEQINMLTDPVRLASQFNPVLKLMIELPGNRQLWSGAEFGEKKQQVRGPLDFPAYALGSMLGGAGINPRTGERYTSSKVAYVPPTLVPTLATVQRLFPQLGGKETYVSRQGSSIAGFSGLPYRRVSKEEQFNELQRRQFAIRDYMSELTRRGILEPKEN